jgi:ABC-type multidrug transport system fused ATPase/permease subunit
MHEETITLRNIDPEEVEDAIKTAEKSFGIKLIQKDLDGVNHFGEFCDTVIEKTGLPHAEGCTTQRAFYKLREAIVKTRHIAKTQLHPSSKLEDIFPKKTRTNDIGGIERYLNLKLHLLKPALWVINSLLIAFGVACVMMFVNWKAGLLAFVVDFLCLKMVNYFSTEFAVTTLGQVAEKMALKHYRASRRNPGTINKKEAAGTIKKIIFSQRLLLPESALEREASFN